MFRLSLSNLNAHALEKASEDFKKLLPNSSRKLNNHFFLHLNNKLHQYHTARLHITSTIVISFATIAPHSIGVWCTLFASACSFIILDVLQMFGVKVCHLSHLLTTITEATLCTMPCLLLECRLIVPFLISAQPKVGLSSLDTQVSAQKKLCLLW